ncbi:Heat-labile enterotoxin, A chain [Metarhizium robertsii ARSEF 23]|uniref:Heat-labile enterotoxin, A chain n=1 Tax=Metarhizium robertsii (strain ARSEF 23 / ATCC MYA-3075) TaxID=655844 RepID=A0A0B2XGW7_METRA|nr:Heat-labile enterotoxin, A chain [Metarhizium robertsii ARSEF 23]KHO11126.1 Heat-labile enterotoxin, A chain [Metarhizium robertsii ARSEF 23]
MSPSQGGQNGTQNMIRKLTKACRSNVTASAPVQDVSKQEQNASCKELARSRVSKSYVQALEGQISALEQVIRKLAIADSTERDEILLELSLSSAPEDGAPLDKKPQPNPTGDHGVAVARLRAGQLRRPRDGNAAQFFGGTSSFQIHFSRDETQTIPRTSANSDGTMVQADCQVNSMLEITDLALEESSSSGSGCFQYAPHDQTSQTLMAAFFTEQYQYNMVVYREYFLRDYDVGSGRYYSDLLLYSMCSLSALLYDDFFKLSDVFSGQAQALLFATLDKPDLTTLQALILLGHREIAVGQTSKGWLFCGMAFRLAHEMGLHLDPSNWDASTSSFRDREILRRVYWGIFIADKQLSLYFGRPPALYPSESDVRNTIRLQYPHDWQNLLETYICRGATVPEYENGVALVGSFIYQAELCKIIHVMIADLFENRRGDVDPAIAAAKSRKIHVSLTKWLASLPGTLHWNQWTVGQVPSPVLHLHMLFHTVMIILHRPPSNMFEKPGISESEDVEICYESLQAILRLMRSYARYYRYRSLPLDFAQTLSTATGAVMMKRFFQKSSWDDPEIERSLSLLTEAMDEIQNSLPCVKEIRDAFDEELGTLITDEFLSAQLQVQDGSGFDFEPFDFNNPPEGTIDSRQ